MKRIPILFLLISCSFILKAQSTVRPDSVVREVKVDSFMMVEVTTTYTYTYTAEGNISTIKMTTGNNSSTINYTYSCN